MSAKFKDVSKATAVLKKALSVECKEEQVAASQSRIDTSNISRPKRLPSGPKYTATMAKHLVLDHMLSPKAKKIYQNYVQVASTMYTV